MVLMAFVMAMLPGLAQAQQQEARTSVSYVDWAATLPAASFGAPLAFGAQWGQAFIGLAGSDGTGNYNKTDGSAAVGLGLGNAQELVGLEVDVTFNSLRNKPNEKALSTGALSLKLHRVLGNGFGVALGMDSVAHWGFKAANAKPSSYLALSKVIELKPNSPYFLVLSGGVGNGQYQNKAFQLNTPNVDFNKIGGFGSAALYVHPQVSLVAGYAGQNLSAGVSLVPLHNLPVVLTLGATDLQKKYGTKAHFVAALGYAISF